MFEILKFSAVKIDIKIIITLKLSLKRLSFYEKTPLNCKKFARKICVNINGTIC